MTDSHQARDSFIRGPFGMVDLFCTPFVDMIQRMRLEFRNQQSHFRSAGPQVVSCRRPRPDAPICRCVFTIELPEMRRGRPRARRSQMAQNLVLSWLAGGRIMELKTVQVNDELKISRPCIDAANIGYNIEWSQELRVADSLDQYVQGAMLIHMLRHAPEVFGNPFGDVSLAGTAANRFTTCRSATTWPAFKRRRSSISSAA